MEVPGPETALRSRCGRERSERPQRERQVVSTTALGGIMGTNDASPGPQIHMRSALARQGPACTLRPREQGVGTMAVWTDAKLANQT